MADVRKLYRLGEAAARYFSGDVESLRQAIIFKKLPVLIEHNGGAWTWEVDETTSGAGEWGRWLLSRGFSPNKDTPDGDGVPCTLYDWLYVSDSFALRVLAGEQVPDMTSIVWLSENMEPWEAFTIHGRDWGTEDLWFLNSDLAEFSGDGQQVPEPKSLGTRERNNLLRAIAGLAAHAGIDLRGDKAVAPIVAAGKPFSGPDDKTVRKWIAQIRDEILPSDWKPE